VTEHGELELTLQDHQDAFTEVSFLLEVLVRTAGEVVGKSIPALGTNAGRHMARKLPIYLSKPDLPTVERAVAQELSAGFDIQGSCAGGGADLKIGRCAVREVCRSRNLELGGELCKMFHHYHAGMVAQLLGRPVRAGAVTAGEPCAVHLDAQGVP
jgi:hypothetical protein